MVATNSIDICKAGLMVSIVNSQQFVCQSQLERYLKKLLTSLDY